MSNLVITEKMQQELKQPEINMLLNIGFVLEKKKEKKPKKVAVTHTISYYLAVKTTCLTCGEVEITSYLMQEQKDTNNFPALGATCPMPHNYMSVKSIEPDKWLNKKVKRCPYCKENLLQWDKEKLVNYLLNRTSTCITCPKRK